MSRDEPARITGVRGGSGSIEATYDAVRDLADRFDAAADEQRAWATSGAAVLVDPDLLTSAPLSPLTFAEAEAAVTAATTGPLGLLPGSCGWEATAVLVRAALAGLTASDVAAEVAIDALDWRLGLLAGLALRLAGPVALATGSTLPPEVRGRLGADVQRWLVTHPREVQHLVNGGGGLLTGLGPFVVPDRRTATALLAAAYADGDPVATRRPDLRVPSAGRQPDSVADLLDHLAQVAALSPDPDSPANGTIEVQTLDPDSDRARHVVYLPGTDDLATLPWAQDHDVRDLGSDLRSAAGESTAYQRGILHALADAGVRPDEPVLLVGHSLGGMEAAALASRDTGLAVTDVVTAGSPTAQVGDFPADVRVLSLEHHGDVVPLLDGADNPDRTAQVTVTFESGHDETVADAHGYEPYRAGAAAVDASTDPAVADQVAGLRERGFLGRSAEVSSQVFQIARDR
ncbi:alpha/beta hydrolase [Nocardioides sp. YIM 152315]|uniref:alpha/beta hydrolase n=1 Tax=Nocardioides sp. YIM 152315 TaxID=3031760 RepID=UPI0023DA2804|nr:alpha/beta hydrolase [Nocardioides sp. YIM 152315]MDF1605261.1 alpha/beta hydrolase [Nocardioides sp. YIM 152315]